jgi:hypothetical protein
LPPTPPPVEAPPAPVQTAPEPEPPPIAAAPVQDGPVVAAVPVQEDAGETELGEEFERKAENSKENTEIDAIYEEKEYTQDSSEVIPSQTKSRFKNILPSAAAFAGAALAIMAGLFGLRLCRKRRKGAGKDSHEKKR